MDSTYLSHFLPKEILEHFTVLKIEERIDISDNALALYITLLEKNILPDSYPSTDYESKGFYPAKQIQDFPIRGKAVYLNVSRRRWRHKTEPLPNVHTDFSFIAKDVKLTKELADFLKSTG